MRSGIASSKPLTQTTSSGARLGIQHRSKTRHWNAPARKACPSLGLDTTTPPLTYEWSVGVLFLFGDARAQRRGRWPVEWAWRDSNPQPRDYESPALTVELQARAPRQRQYDTVPRKR